MVKNSTKTIAEVINNWCKNYDINKEQFYILLKRLNSLDGDKSFKDTIQMLLKLWQNP